MIKYIIVIVLLISVKAFSQTDEKSFRIINNTDNKNESEYVEALKNANLDKYRMETESRILVFNTGIKVELLSANELRQKNLDFKENLISKEQLPKIVDAVFKLTADGYILEEHTCNNKNK